MPRNDQIIRRGTRYGIFATNSANLEKRMARDKPLLRAIKLLTLIERNGNGLRVTDMAEQLGAPPRAIYRDLQVLEQLPVPLYKDKSGKESFWKIDPDYRNRLSIPFSLSELLSLYFAQDSMRSWKGRYSSSSWTPYLTK